MDWDVNFVASPDKEDVRIIRDTLEARLKADSGQYGEAARMLWELLIQMRHVHNRRWECITLAHMGKVYRVLRWSIAVQLFEEVLELADAIGFDQAKMIALAELGEMKCSWGQLQESLDLFFKALDLVQDGDLERRREILLDMVLAYEGLDELQRCRELLEEILEIDQRLQSDETEEDQQHFERICMALAE